MSACSPPLLLPDAKVLGAVVGMARNGSLYCPACETCLKVATAFGPLGHIGKAFCLVGGEPRLPALIATPGEECTCKALSWM